MSRTGERRKMFGAKFGANLISEADQRALAEGLIYRGEPHRSELFRLAVTYYLDQAPVGWRPALDRQPAEDQRAGQAMVGHSAGRVALTVMGPQPAALSPQEADQLADLLRQEAQRVRDAADPAAA